MLFNVPEPVLEVLDSLVDTMKFPVIRCQSDNLDLHQRLLTSARY